MNDQHANESAKPPPSEEETLFVYQQLFALLVAQRKTIVYGGFAVAFAMFAIGVNADTLYWWLLWMLLFAVGTFRHFHIRSPKIVNVQTVDIALTMNKIVRVQWHRGVIFALALLFFPSLSDIQRQTFTVITMGVCIGAIATNAGHTKLYWSFAAPFLFTLGVLWIIIPSQEHTLLQCSLMGLLILFVLIPMFFNYAKSSWNLYDESCRMRFREHDLNTQLQDALRVAEQANRAKNRFLAAASHDLRQPLHVIGFTVSALKLRNLDSKSSEMVTLLNNASSSLQFLLNSLLDVSKLDSGLVEVKLEATSIRKLAVEFYRAYSHLADAKGLKSSLNIAQDDPFLTMTDSLLLLRMFSNIGQNALKFTQQGSIDFTVFSDATHVVMELQDTGCGIPAEHQEAVFQEFFQVHNPAREQTQGLGLGLSIVRRLAKLLDVQITLSSQEGVGTKFRLAIPIVMPSQEQMAESGVFDDLLHKTIQRTDFNLNVLVIDNEAGVLEASKMLLGELGCRCWVATDLNEARAQLAAMQPLRPDLLMVDLRLNGPLNGIEVTQLLRQDLGEPEVHAVIISGDTASERLQLTKAAGLPICHKPLTLKKFRLELSRVCQHKS